MKKYNLAKREGAYQKAPSGPKRGHIERARIDRGDLEQGYLGVRAERLRLFFGLYTFVMFFRPQIHCEPQRWSSLC